MPKPSFYKVARFEQGSTNQILVLFLLALIFASLIVAVIGYKFGYRQGLHSNERVATAVVGASADNTALNAENTKLKEDLVNAVQERDISRSTLESLRTDFEDLKTTNMQLEQVNELLKNSVAEQGGVALNIMASEIISLPQNAYEYRFDVSMIDISGQAVQMVPKLTLLNSTSMVEIPLVPASYEIKGVANIRGRFIMPEGFEPQQMKIELVAGTQKVQQLYNWRVGRIITDAPPSLTEMPNTSNRPIKPSEE